MTILALLIALALERIVVKTPSWQLQYYANHYFTWLDEKQWLTASSGSIIWLAIALVPAAAVSLIIDLLPGALLEFVLQTFFLFLCLGSQVLRDTYKCFLQAANRGDLQSCYLYTQQMGHCNTKPDQAGSFGLRLVWLNYQHYAAVVLWFVALGAPGAVFYVVIREAFEFACGQEDYSISAAQAVRDIADWIPVRIIAFGMLLVGNFAHGFSNWLTSLLNFSESPVTTLTSVSAAAEILPGQKDVEADPTLEPAMLIKLAKRNMMFLLVAVSILTFVDIL